MSITIKIEGMKRLRSAFKKSPGIIRIQIQKAINLSTILIQREARKITPVSQIKGKPGGHLRRGIGIKITPFKGLIESKVGYGIFVHEGTRRWPLSKPPKKIGTVRQFMKIGAEKSERRVQVMFQKVINNVVNKIAK